MDERDIQTISKIINESTTRVFEGKNYINPATLAWKLADWLEKNKYLHENGLQKYTKKKFVEYTLKDT